MYDFFLMGGYGSYIWSAYLFSFSLLNILLFINISKLRKKEKILNQLIKDSD
jgi:heme exporter protein CcmD|tara:strand:+ start:179 stop:334 length:156 start_codon:yes stop_codon:yes gene_type:complete